MHGAVDAALVGVVFLASIIYALFALGPKSLRGRLLLMAAAMLRRAPLPVLRALAARIERRTVTAGGACGGCGSCGAEKPAAGHNEVVIPAAKIGRR